MGLASTPAFHFNFYRDALAAVGRDAKALRVLVSGAADYGMLVCVIAACRGNRVEPEVTVVDLCETPLMLNQWYAERVSCRIATVCGDLADFSDAGRFDAICTHSFFSELPAERREKVVENWHRLLRPGGVVITANRIRPSSGNEPVGFTREQAQEFRATVLRCAESMRTTLEVAPLELAQEAERYAGHRRAFPLRSREEILGLFETAGLQVDQLSFTSAEAGMRAAVTGPTTPGAAEYAYIVARRA
jgi:SAM-dependent methyltransferase